MQQITTTQEMIAGIDRWGNTLAFVLSDQTSLQYVREYFSGTIPGIVADVLASRPNGSFDTFAIEIKLCLASDCLRAVQYAIYADDVVEESELDNAYLIIKPLVAFYQQYLGGRYARFKHLQRSGVFDFLHTHMTDTDFFGGKIQQTKSFYEGKPLAPADSLALQGEHISMCLSVIGTIFSDGSQLCQLCSDIVYYPIFYILSDGRGFSVEDLNHCQEQKEINRFVSYANSQAAVINALTLASNSQMKRIQLDNSYHARMGAGYKHITNWWQQNQWNIPTVSHFPESFFEDLPSVPVPQTSGVVVPTPCVSHISVQENRSQDTILKEALDELNDLEGLATVKSEINNLIAFLKIQKERAQHGMKVSSQALHYVFHGNPGTGKNTVARIIAKIFHGFGILKTSKFTETDRSGLVAGFVGQTAIKTDEIIQNSLDGVLFIDEAYTLSKGSSGQDFGQEAIDTLLKRMEDYRDRLIVIVAGYPALMQQFILSNPGLSSRFTRSITFEDYSIPEMCRIFEGMCQKEEYQLSKEALAYACILFSLAYHEKDEHFGNGRFVRNIYENTTMKQSARLAIEQRVTKTALGTLEQTDIPFEKMANFDAKQLDLSQSRWSGICPGCQKKFEAKLDFIGQKVQCKCQQTFKFPWWNPVTGTISGVPVDKLAINQADGNH